MIDTRIMTYELGYMLSLGNCKQLLVFSVSPFKINRNKNQNRSIDKVQNL